MTQPVLALAILSISVLLSACDGKKDYGELQPDNSSQESIKQAGAQSTDANESNQDSTQTDNNDSEIPQLLDSASNSDLSNIQNIDSTQGESQDISGTESDTAENQTEIPQDQTNPTSPIVSDKDTSTTLFFSNIHQQVIQANCVNCHTSTGIAGNTQLVFELGGIDQEFNNKCVLDNFIFSAPNNHNILKDKPRGLSQHGGGSVMAFSSSQYTLWSEYIDSISFTQNGGMPDSGNTDNSRQFSLESKRNTYRRASLILTGQIPSAQSLQEVDQLNESQLKDALHNLMQGPGFHEFIKTSANDKLLVRRLEANAYREIGQGLDHHYPEYKTIATDNTARDELARELEEEPLELMAYVIENDKPYSEILTANYTLASKRSAHLFKAPAQESLIFKPVQNHGQTLIAGRFTDFEVDAPAQIPHAGILSSYAYLNKYPTTATNRNRGRATTTLKHFLGFDVEDSTGRELSNDALSDQENPTLNNPACVACHKILDPVAGAFQNFGSQGVYRDRRYGLDALDSSYAETDKTSPYQSGDTWYRDMLAPGFYLDTSSDNNNSLNWLGHQLVNDDRFAMGTIKFWWPAIFGEPLLQSGANRTQLDSQTILVEKFASDFTEHLNLKTLLLDMLMSDFFRADKLTVNADENSLSLHGGAKRLLTPEQLQEKIRSITGFIWNESDPKLTNDYNLYYGGIDSNEVESRASTLSNVMARVTEKSALVAACPIVASEFNLPNSQRKLFTEVERNYSPGNYNKSTLTLQDGAKAGLQLVNYKVNAAKGIVKIVMKKPIGGKVFWQSIRITDQDQNEIISGNMGTLVADLPGFTGSGGPTYSITNNEKNAYYLCCSSRQLEMQIPIEQAGDINIEMQMWASEDDTHIDVTIDQSAAESALTDNYSIKIKQQLVVLYERLLNETHQVGAPEIQTAFELFKQLRQAKISRGSHPDMRESNIDCSYYDSNGVEEAVWAEDSSHTLTAWRGVLAALMMDSAFIYE